MRARQERIEIPDGTYSQGEALGGPSETLKKGKNPESFPGNEVADSNDYLPRDIRAKVVPIHPQFVVHKKPSIS
jgi:hypothetical protein